MSYHVYLEIDAGGPSPVEIYWRDHTSNTAGIWRAAGADVAKMDGAPAVECAGALSRAADRIVADLDAYRRFEPRNGHGTVESTVSFLRDLASACANAPKAVVVVSR